MSEKKAEPARTEILHSEDQLDYPLDVPSSGDTSTTAFLMADRHERTSVDPQGPLPYGEDEPEAPVYGDRREIAARGTTDLGLLALRLVVGVLLALRGLQKLFGLFHGPGIDGFGTILSQAGFRYPEVLAVVGGVVELVAAVALVLGLVTPVASAALFGVVGLGLVIQIAGPETPAVLGEGTKGLETAILYAGALLALLFAGPGRLSADRRWRWSHHPRFSGVVWFLIAVAAGVAIWSLLNGRNPLGDIVQASPVPTP